MNRVVLRCAWEGGIVRLVSVYLVKIPRLCYKGNAVPLQAWTGPEGSRKLRFPDFVTTAQDGSKVVSFTYRFVTKNSLLILLARIIAACCDKNRKEEECRIKIC